MTNGPTPEDLRRAIVLRAPDAIVSLVRSGAASIVDLDISARIRLTTGIGLDGWLPLLEDIEREQLVRRLGNLLAVLDELDTPPLDMTPWPPRMTNERRSFVLKHLGLPESVAADVATRNPLPLVTQASPLVWVDPNAQPVHAPDFLERTGGRRWLRYKAHLEDGMNWPAWDVASMERDLNELVQAFPDPREQARSPRRLLVVGFTQSGKTANFLGLAARMADAGSQLFIILSGRTRILRRQTQARIDRDLIGEDPVNVGVLRQEYATGHRLLERLAKRSEPWSDDLGWTRITQSRYGRGIGSKAPGGNDDDAYQRPQGGLASRDRSRPIIAVLKKTPGDLDTFNTALAAAPVAFRRLPAIVIDEEADDASLNYRAKKAQGGGWAAVESEDERSTVNRLISEMLDALEAGVYVGYTATPFANCFADAGDDKGFFPHAIQVLQTPEGYFGASRVFNALYDGPPTAILPKAAHIREIHSGHDVHAELDEALDDYIIAGAVKLFRQRRAITLADDRAIARLRHHTMMVHIGTTREAQRQIVQETTDRLFNRAGRGLGVMSPGETADRLRDRFERDVEKSSRGLTSTPGRLPTRALDERWVPNWSELRPFVVEAAERLVRLHRGESVVLLVNSDEDRATPEYDADASELGRWCVLVGGLMLSRGFTVEGLSTVYFRRTASAMDTQLQLARWNGYRSYFEDVIRIYFGVEEASPGGKPPRNLLQEFEASARRDAQFREKLRRYAEEGTSPRVELPTFLDEKSDAALRPTAPNKMRGVIRQTGAPIEFGRHGLGLPPDAQSLARLANSWSGRPFANTVICDSCARSGRGEIIGVALGQAPVSRIRSLIAAFSKSDTTVRTPDDQQSLEGAFDLKRWTVALIGMTRDPDEGSVGFAGLEVPVRLRTRTDEDTLSTGQWNRWLRTAVGDDCMWCGATQSAATPAVLALLPYVTVPGDMAGVRWGAIVQIKGRSRSGSILVAGPSRRTTIPA